MTKKTISCFLLLLPSLIWANINATIQAVPGGIAEVTFVSDHKNPKAFYGIVPLYVQKLNNIQHQALIGLPLMTKSGSKRIGLQGAHQTHDLITVINHTYDNEYFESNIKQTNTNIVEERVEYERDLFTKARKTFSKKSLSEGYFTTPTIGRVTSGFGVNRYYNGKQGLPHMGIDIANNIGTPVNTCATGQVILVHDFHHLGKTVVVDHGQGLITSYSHLSKISVIKGQLLRRGEELGKIGTSGRSTGPHLHWGVFLNQVAINPELLLIEPL